MDTRKTNASDTIFAVETNASGRGQLSCHWLRPLLLAGLLAALGVALISPRPLPEAPPMPEVNLRFVALTNGLMYRIGQSWPLTGVVFERYSSGQIKSRSGVVNGRLEGLSEGWHTNGVRQVEEPFRAGKSHGLRRKWYASGRLLSTAEIVAGQLHGVFRQWHENGRMAEEIPMRHGQPHGVSRAWFPDGALKARACLVAGNVQEQEYFEDNGMRLASPK